MSNILPKSSHATTTTSSEVTSAVRAVLFRCTSVADCLPVGSAKPQAKYLTQDISGKTAVSRVSLLQNVVALPKQYPMWKEGCYLTEPLGIPMGFRGGPVKFKLNIPGARNVQVISARLRHTETQTHRYKDTYALSLTGPHGLTFTWWGCCDLCL